VTPYYADESVTLFHGDCLDVMREVPGSSIDAVVTDPPYGLEFMGREWDAPWQRGTNINADAGFSDVFMTDGFARLPRPSFTGSTNPVCLNCGGKQRGRRDETAKVRACAPCDAARFPNVRAVEMQAFGAWCGQWSRECLRVLKPGGHLLAFGGSRTWHRLACAVEDAGFEVRDSIAWLYGSGFPKSLDVSKAVDKGAGFERPDGAGFGPLVGKDPITAPATDAARRWQGWGTALKPAFEPIVVARKPPAGTVASNVLAHGTGALNIDRCRVAATGRPARESSGRSDEGTLYGAGLDGSRSVGTTDRGRWPTNVVLDDTQAAELDRQSGTLTSGRAGQNGHVRNQPEREQGIYGGGRGLWTEEGPAGQLYGDSGGASRFFPTFRYEAKAPTVERPRDGEIAHPTVKPLDLMRWLVRLVTPPGGTVLEPFAGSGTTAEACVIEGFRCVAIEREAAYLPLIVARLSKPIQPDLFGGVA
jgi:DNA modification methylase